VSKRARKTAKRPAGRNTGTAAKRLLALCRKRELKIATAESCTGGLVAAALTEVPGSSDVLDCGFVTYSNAAKQRMLGVTALTLERAGAVSREAAEEMAHGALAHSDADLAVAITGIAGPGGATPGKPVGLVHLAAGGRFIARSAMARSAAARCGSTPSPSRSPCSSCSRAATRVECYCSILMLFSRMTLPQRAISLLNSARPASSES
jgi:PncC family amidohydrolase